MNQQESRELLLSVFGVAMLIVVLTGITFAMLFYTSEGKVSNYLTTGSIKMSYDESDTKIIFLTNALPISDEVGKKLTDYFDFNVSSTINGLITIKYKILISKISVQNEIDDKYIKLYLEKEDNGIYKSVVKPISLIYVNKENMMLYSDEFINAKNKKVDFISKYRLRIWLDDSYTMRARPESFKMKVLSNFFSAILFVLCYYVSI